MKGARAVNTTDRQPRGVADATRSFRHVFVRDLEINATLGIYEHEKLSPQRVIINIDLSIKERGEPLEDDISNVVSYEKVVDLIKEIVATGHVHLVETLAEMIAARCLENDWITGVRVRVEKPDIIPEARSVGVEIERLRTT
ncbi:MAG: dihydroneopterin aldolase [Rhizobiales bacterium]|nr:dihydroneopterin aldolase [Hyphomicrobiales bacterium]